MMKPLLWFAALTLTLPVALTLEACQSAGREAECSIDVCLEQIDGTAGGFGEGGAGTGGTVGGTAGSALGGASAAGP